MKCPNCHKKLRKKDLKWFAEVDYDVTGAYVIYVGRCPDCYEEIETKFGYKTDPDEPLRHEW
jgi:hypothetical protein